MNVGDYYLVNVLVNQVQQDTKYLPHEPFDTHIGDGQVLGNLSGVSLNFGNIVVQNATIGIPPLNDDASQSDKSYSTD